MKETAFIISEYNPFHNGHKFHIDETRRAGAKNVICIMNGNFMQRCEPSLLSKTARAEIAVKNGADLVLELPLKYGISSANYFAFGGINTAFATGLDGTLSFGAKANALQIKYVADILCKEDNLRVINDLSKANGVSFPVACTKFLEEKYPEYSNITADANNVLGIEYVKAINGFNWQTDIFTVERSVVSRHDSLTPDDNIASAKLIRTLIAENRLDETERYMPKVSFDILKRELDAENCVICHKRFSDIVFSGLLTLKANDFTDINGIGQGLENKILAGIKTTSSLDSLCEYVKTKRFTYSRIKQSLLSAYFNIGRADLSAGVSYIRVLSFNENGRKLLRTIEARATVPVITKLSDVSDNMPKQALSDRELDYLSGKIYELCKKNPKDINPEYLIKPYYSK